ncbi:hypothetical protein [Clostridium sardiniense]|uniref:hypothetical protein n=1 Tax=Clostridium sardiniense TaxID=29369 RepID=UPI00195896DF|nr:hypothetical protein [Clostridium sardiniense]MBM7835759.1 hypothetical protein [Clostridium sardiniense]
MSNSIITNRIFYKLYDKEDESILNNINKKDGKVILILNSLYYLTNRLDVANTTLKKLIESCKYSDVPKNINSFKDILYKLKEIHIIDFQQEIKDKNTFLEINCSNLIDKDDGYFNFFKLEQEEIELIRSNTTNNQNFMTQLKVYCYLKARVKKIDGSRNIYERCMGEAEVTWKSYDNITKYTGVSAVEKAITNLKEIGLIDYINAGNKNNKIKHNNIYALTKISKDVKGELKEGLKQYRYWEKRINNKI